MDFQAFIMFLIAQIQTLLPDEPIEVQVDVFARVWLLIRAPPNLLFRTAPAKTFTVIQFGTLFIKLPTYRSQATGAFLEKMIAKEEKIVGDLRVNFSERIIPEALLYVKDIIAESDPHEAECREMRARTRTHGPGYDTL